ncbi:hypothetical protein BJV78DRAFT_804428 [Lactifluus subvellereus]|nr:hypothetical protein BJV78DRAFT_804428 [Lactifluus subvellereus]
MEIGFMSTLVAIAALIRVDIGHSGADSIHGGTNRLPTSIAALCYCAVDCPAAAWDLGYHLSSITLLYGENCGVRSKTCTLLA